MNPSPIFPETPDIETSSDDYARRFAGEVGAWFLRVQKEATLRLLTPYPGARILDVGGGHGQLVDPLVEHGYGVTVLGSAESCGRRIQGFIDQGRCTFQIGNLLDLPYPEQHFDVVISYRLLAHLKNWPQYLAELARVARYAVIIDYSALRSLNYIAPYLFALKKGLEGNTRPFSCFRESELLAVFGDYGFIPAQRYPQFFLPMVLHRTIKIPRLSLISEKISQQVGLTPLFGSPVILKVVRQPLIVAE
jgi:2-polyprenyl-3-methyl-5-hydroxy-6-metoxy-1,4-benzoquinol methylase